jgi:hypothetical protein
LLPIVLQLHQRQFQDLELAHYQGFVVLAEYTGLYLPLPLHPLQHLLEFAQLQLLNHHQIEQLVVVPAYLMLLVQLAS